MLVIVVIQDCVVMPQLDRTIDPWQPTLYVLL